MKKSITVLMAVALMLSLLCVSAFAVETEVVAVNDAGDTFTSLEAAIWDTYDIYEQGTVTLVATNYTLTNNLSIPEGITLVIPTSASYNDTLTGNNISSSALAGNPYVTLTVPDGKTLEVNGTLLVAGNQQSSTKNAGCLTGNYGKIDVAGSLTVNGTLYARGEISGVGTVTANNGSTVYQLFQIKDWRGGTASLSAYNNKVFPFNLYEFDSITARTVYMYGSTMKAHYYIYANNLDNEGDVVIIGNGGQLVFENTAAGIESGNIVFTNADGVTNVEVNGAVKTGDIAVTVSQTIWGYTISYTLDSSTAVCPFGYNMNVVISNGASLAINNNMKILPGCNISVANGGALNIADGKAAYFYTVGEGGYVASYNCLGWNAANAATLTVETGGTVTGTIASTDASFANVGGFTAGTTTATVNEVTQSGTSVTLVPVTFTVGVPSAE